MAYKRDPNYRDPMTDFGIEVTVFCARHCLTKKRLAEEAGVPYDSLLAAMRGRRAGHNVKEALGPVMKRYEAEAKRQQRGRGA